MWIPLREMVKLTGLHPNTLQSYARKGKIKTIRSGGGRKYLYQTDGFVSERRSGVICYCRVSSAKQKDDLTRQVAFMRSKFPEADIIKDVGSGLNFKRKGLLLLLERLMRGDKLTIIVAHRDRLCRFGFELFEYLAERNGGEIMVLNDNEVSPEQELTEDLLAILTVFSCRMHGLRRYTDRIKEDKNIFDERTEENL